MIVYLCSSSISSRETMLTRLAECTTRSYHLARWPEIEESEQAEVREGNFGLHWLVRNIVSFKIPAFQFNSLSRNTLLLLPLSPGLHHLIFSGERLSHFRRLASTCELSKIRVWSSNAGKQNPVFSFWLWTPMKNWTTTQCCRCCCCCCCFLEVRMTKLKLNPEMAILWSKKEDDKVSSTCATCCCCLAS